MAKKILVVEDEQNIATALVTKIQNAGFEVIQSTDGEDALIKSLETHPDLILLDLILPKLDGMSLLENIRQDEWGKNVPVIILTNLGTGDEIERSKKLSVNEFLIKTDWKLDDVISKIKTLIE